MRNVWVVQFGMIACAGIVPLALVCGPIRGIPPFWTAVDLSFGVFGVIPLALAYRHIRLLERSGPPAAPTSSPTLVAPASPSSA